MKISKRQLNFVEMIEQVGWVWRHEVCTKDFPDTLIDSAIQKGLIVECKGKLSSGTKADKESK